MTSKKQEKPTKSGAVVLEESQLDQAQGGANTYVYFKLDSVDSRPKTPLDIKS